MPVTVICTYCGIELRRSSSQVHKNNFCSYRCQAKWRIGNTKGKNGPRWKGGLQDVPCAICGKLIKRAPCKIKIAKNHFCSEECHSTWISKNYTGENHPNWKRKIYNCTYCGKELPPKTYHKGNKYHFCDIQCRGKWITKYRSGKNSSAWRHGQTLVYGPNWFKQRNAAQKRDNYKCCICGKYQKGRGQSLNVHHIKPVREFGYVPGENENYLQANQLSNLICLCRSCHNKVEPHPELLEPYL